MKKIAVISLGGSLIVPEKVDFKFLKKFREALRRHYAKYKFIIVCGGGTVARKYIAILKENKSSEKDLSLAGIMATRMNARVVMRLFGKEANDTLPMNMNEVVSNLHKNSVVVCGALRYAEKSTSDGTAAKLAHLLKAEFINMTNIKGLYSSNPFIHKNAKFIPIIGWKEFEKMADKSKYQPGQHFVLDQQAAKIIKKNKIKTYIIGPNGSNLSKILNKKKFTGTLIYG